MMKEENINCTIEALILASPEPVSVNRLCETLDDVSPARVRRGIADLNNLYMGCGGSFRIRELAGGYQMYILPDFEQPIKRLLTKERTVRLSRAALEALAIIAYRQPVTKIEVEHIRGVASDGVIHNLLQRKLILMSGRSEGPGRPLLYKTSQEFLKYFGLNHISDLPRMDEIEEMIRQAGGSRQQELEAYSENLLECRPENSDDASGGNGSGNNGSDKNVAILLNIEPGSEGIKNEEALPDAGAEEQPDSVESESETADKIDLTAEANEFREENMPENETPEPGELKEMFEENDTNISVDEHVWDDDENALSGADGPEKAEDLPGDH